MRNRTREVEIGAELLHLIQSRLPLEEAARTSVLSKSWLHAWSTIPTLRFCVGEYQETKSMKLVDMDRTLRRYLRDNIPIETFDLNIDFENQESASHAEYLICSVVTKTCLKEFFAVVDFSNPDSDPDPDPDPDSDSDSDSDPDPDSDSDPDPALDFDPDPDLDFDPDPDLDSDSDPDHGPGTSFMLPDEILLGENLTMIRVIRSSLGGKHALRMTNSHHPVIKCVSLQELHLDGVHISEEALHHILSSCNLLEKIELLHSCKGFNTIRVKNLKRLKELSISLSAWRSPALEISDVPNLQVFSYNQDEVWLGDGPPPLAFNANVHSISLLSSVTELVLEGVIADNACLDMITSGFPSLESLTLKLTTWIFESFYFTCASIKSLSLLRCPPMLTDVQVQAPKLLFFMFNGDILPNLLFPVSSLEKIEFALLLRLPVDASFFIKMRQALTLSRECDLQITTDNYSKRPINIDLKDLRTRPMFPPAKNVQKLSFETIGDKCQWERSPFFDAFFEICHPELICARPDLRFKHNNHFGRVMLKEVLEKKKTTTGTADWPQYLKHVQNWETFDKKWETLTNSHRSLLDGSAPSVWLDFKLEWR